MKLTKILLIPLLAVVVFIAACSTSWIATAEQYITVLTPAIEDIVGILSLTGVLAINSVATTAVTKYSAQAGADLATINTLLTQYNASNATTTTAKINTAAADAAQNLNLILPALHITDANTVAKVTDAVNLAVNTITELTALIPNNTTSATALARAAKAKPPSPSALQKQFNQIFSR